MRSKLPVSLRMAYHRGTMDHLRVGVFTSSGRQSAQNSVSLCGFTHSQALSHTHTHSHTLSHTLAFSHTLTHSCFLTHSHSGLAGHSAAGIRFCLRVPLALRFLLSATRTASSHHAVKTRAPLLAVRVYFRGSRWTFEARGCLSVANLACHQPHVQLLLLLLDSRHRY